MTDITTATVAGSPGYTQWNVPDGSIGPFPRGMICFQGGATSPSKLSTDQNKWTLQMILPKGFVYRIVESRVRGNANQTNSFYDPEYGMVVDVTTNTMYEDNWSYMLYHEQYARSGGGDNGFLKPFAIASNFGSADPDQTVSFSALIEPGGLIHATGTAQLLLTWMDVSADSTNAILLTYRFRLLQYTVEQARAFPIYTPVPTIHL